MLRNFIHDNRTWIGLIIATSLIVILIAILSLSRGINDIFPYFFLIPVILAAYAFPERAVMVTIALAGIYFVLVWMFGTLSATMIAVHTAWFFVFITLGIVISHFAQLSKQQKNEVEHLKREAFRQLENTMEQLLILNDQMRNPLQAILLDAARLDDKTNTLITDQVKIIEIILNDLDERCLESEKIRKYLRKYYGFEGK
jgi:glucose-6-phosphate-specific signal transduction histidine kinase